MNLGTIRTNVASVLGLDNSVAGDQTLIDQWANEAVVDILMQTDVYVNCANVTLTSGTDEYDLASTILKIRYAYLDPVTGSNRLMERKSPFEIIDMRIRTSNNTGGPYCYAVQGDNRLMLYPTPAAADVMRLWYVPKPSASMNGPNDDPSSNSLGGIPTQYHDLIVDYALWRGADHEDDADSQGGERYAQRYALGIKEVLRNLQRKGGVRQPQAIRARSRTRGLSSSDVYPRY